MRKLLHFPFFGLLLGIFPLIALWNYNKSQIYARDVVFSLLITLVFVILIWGLTWLIFRSLVRASISSSLIFLFFFSFGHVYNLMKRRQVFGFSVGFVKLLGGYLVIL